MAEGMQLYSPEDSAWDEWVKSVEHDIYYTAAYHQLAVEQGEGSAWLAVYSDSQNCLLWPYLIRRIDDTYDDAHAVYGYTGPIGNGLDDPEFMAKAWAELNKLWQSQNLVSIFFRYHPLLENYKCMANSHGEAAPEGGEVFFLGSSVSIDLLLSASERQSNYAKNTRQEIKAARRKGLTVSLDTEWENIDAFVELYKQTMQKNQAEDRYMYDAEYFGRLRTALRGHSHLFIAWHESHIAGVLLTTICGRYAQAHLTGVAAEFARLSPLKVLIDSAADHLAGLGAEQLHLGGGRGGWEDDLFQFKSRFSKIRHDFRSGRYIINSEVYGKLSQPYSHLGAERREKFFPNYRIPSS